jgi:LytS/YehU family sensor histidine kinase
LALLAGLRGAITIGGLAAAIKLMKYWYVKEQQNAHLQKENMSAQLALLQSQVHPHFLFNTMNNIYANTQEKAPEAAHLVTGLSDMLRYMLYECNEPRVSLEKELKLVQDYMTLERARYDERLELLIDIPETAGYWQIAPLLLLPFIENSFKHGASCMPEHPWIHLQISISGNQFSMKLVNGKNSISGSPDIHQGLGIDNAKKRLELLYPGKHQLQIFNEEAMFIVKLKLELTELPEKLSNKATPTYHYA